MVAPPDSLRLLPHDQDTGGFFVCVLERVEKGVIGKAVEAVTAGIKRAISPSAPQGTGETDETNKKIKLDTKEAAAAVDPSTPDETSGEVAEEDKVMKPPKAELKQGKSDPFFKEDAFFFINPEDPELKTCIDFFKLSADFPKDRVFVRNGTGEVSRTMYIANPALKSLIQGNDYSHAHLLSAGIKIFTRQDSKTNPTDTYCKWRIPSDGLSTMMPFLDQSTILHANVDDLKHLLEQQYPLVSGMRSGVVGLSVCVTNECTMLC